MLKYLLTALSLALFSFGTLVPSHAQIVDDRYPSWENRLTGKPQYKKQKIVKTKVAKKQRTYRGRNISPYIAHNHNPNIVYGAFEEVKKAGSIILGGRPAGCPHRFCGCALSIKLFGRIVPHLNLAANWLKFPRTAPAPGMVAARKGHVFKLLAHVSGDTWQVWDANSGRGKIRIHNRRIAGFVIVNPSG